MKNEVTIEMVLCLLFGYLLGYLWAKGIRLSRRQNNDCFAKMAGLIVTKEGIDHLRKYLRKNRGGK